MKPISCFRSSRWLLALVFFASGAPAADHADGLFVLDEAAAAVILIQPLATTQDLLWSGLPLVAPTDMELEDDGALLIADPGAGAIFRFDWAAGIDPEPFILSGIDSCWNLRLSDDEVLTSGPSGLIRFNAATGGQTQLPTAVVDPFDIDFLPNGDILVADPGAQQLLAVDPLSWEGTPFSSGSSNCWLDVDPAGQVAAVGPDGLFLVPAQGGDPRFITNGAFLPNPSGVAFGAHGDIYVADRGTAGAGAVLGGQAPTIVRVDPATGQPTVVASGGFLLAPSAVVVPEPGFLAMLGSGALLLGLLARRQAR